MGVFTYEEENFSIMPPVKLYNTLLKNANTILPKLVPAIKSVEIIEGSGIVIGAIIKITSVEEGGNTKYELHKLDAMDEANLSYKYSIVGGNILPDTLEKISVEAKLVGGSDGGSVVKNVIKYHTKGDVPPSEEHLESDREKGRYLFKALEGYAIAHLDECN